MKTSNETLVSNLELSGNFSEVLSSIKQGQQYLTSLEMEYYLIWGYPYLFEFSNHHISVSDIKNSPNPNIGDEISVTFEENDVVAYYEE